MSVDDGENDPTLLRVSDAERQHVLDLLQRALERGMLDPAEFHERSLKAAEARIRRDLNELVIDLPVVRTAGVDRGAPVMPTGPDDVVELRGSFSSVKRKGDWLVPRKLVLQRKMGSVELDFTEARIDHAVVEIELDIKGGSVELRLPEQASVSTDGVEVTLGSVEDHRKSRVSTGQPHFLITGTLSLGSLELRGPRRSLFGRY
jgi:hypothetical protein